MADEVIALIQSKQGLILLLLLIPLLLLYIRKTKAKLRIKNWQKSLNLGEHASIFQHLYTGIDGFLLSHQARQQQDAIDYVYGEIEFLPFIALLSLVKPNKETVFYDLGSGTGKAVIACAMVYPVFKSVGVELFSELYLNACSQSKKLAEIHNYETTAKKIEFIQGDFLEVNLDEATLIFINSSALFGSTWEKLSTRLNNLPLLSTVITTSKTLLSNNFTLISTTKIQMSWGVVLAYIHCRKTNFY